VDELAAFQEFIGRHVTKDPDRYVQRMLLWTEWVRFYLRKTRHFPEAVLEKKFDELIVGQFGISIAVDDFRGPVYIGLTFVA